MDEEDIVINRSSSARKTSDPVTLENTKWIRENPKVKRLLCLLSESEGILQRYEPLITGSAAVMVHLIATYQSGKIDRNTFEGLIAKLKPVNDLDVVVDSPINLDVFASYDFFPEVDKSIYHTEHGKTILETNGMPFVKNVSVIDALSEAPIHIAVQLEVIIEKVGKNKKPKATTEKVIHIATQDIRVKVLTQAALLSAYDQMDEPGRDDAAKIEVLRELVRMVPATPTKATAKLASPQQQQSRSRSRLFGSSGDPMIRKPLF